jgi:mannitol/fructose-specific phosphotransferase system IIA component (Ntr-type)
LRPAIGGFLVGAIGLFIPSALGTGYGIVQTALDGQISVVLLLLFGVAKAFTSALTAGSGGAGGLFAPSLVVGGAIGGVVGQLAAQWAPGLDIQPAAFVVVGMGGFFAAVVNAPISTVIMVAEVVGNYQLLVPALWVCAITWLLTRRWHLFTQQASTRLDAPSQLADMMGAVLHRMTVAEALDPDEPPIMTVPPNLSLRKLVQLFAESGQEIYPILSRNDQSLLGVVDGRLLRRTIGEQGVDQLLLAHDFQAPARTITPSDTLHEAVVRMTSSGYDALVVIDDKCPEPLRAVLSRRDVVTAYHRRMLARAPGAEADKKGPEKKHVDLIAALRRGGIVPGLVGDSPEACLAQLVGTCPLPEIWNRPELLGLLLERESMGSTGVGNGLALPHLNIDELGGEPEPRIVIGLLDKAVDWESFDGRPVDVVVMLLSPSGDVHLQLLRQLASALSDSEVRQLLNQRASVDKLCKRMERTLQ